jgi:hypothetical protein
LQRNELGQQKIFRIRNVTLYSLARNLWPVMLYQEIMASYHSHKSLDGKNKWQTYRYLAPAFLSYALDPIATPIASAGYMAYQGTKYAAKQTYRAAKAAASGTISAVAGTYNAVAGACGKVKNAFDSLFKPKYRFA